MARGQSIIVEEKPMDPIEVEIDPLFADLIEDFIANRREDMNTLENNLQAGEWQEIEKLCHKIAGNAGSYGLDQLGEWAKEAELLAPQNNTEKISGLFAQMEDYLSRVKPIIGPEN